MTQIEGHVINSPLVANLLDWGRDPSHSTTDEIVTLETVCLGIDLMMDFIRDRQHPASAQAMMEATLKLMVHTQPELAMETMAAMAGLLVKADTIIARGEAAYQGLSDEVKAQFE